MGLRPPRLPRLYRTGRLDLAELAEQLFDERQARQNEDLNEALRECGLGTYVDAKYLERLHSEALDEELSRRFSPALQTEWMKKGLPFFSSPIGMILRVPVSTSSVIDLYHR